MPIRAWNGSAWIQPKFWTGSQWKQQTDYVPAVPAVMSPVGDYTFDSNIEGWVGSDYDQAGNPYWKSGGYLRIDMNDSGLLAAASIYSPSQGLGGSVPVGTQYRCEARFQLLRLSGSAPNTVDYTVRVGDSETTATRAEGNSGWLVINTPLASTTNTFQSLGIYINVDCGDLGGDSMYAIEVDYARIENSAGGLLMYESVEAQPAQDAWPKWWNGSAWVN